MDSANQTLSPEDVARQLGTSEWWIREQARRGRIPHLRLGKGRLRFLPTHVNAITETFTVMPVAEVAGIQDAFEVFGATARSTSQHRSSRPAFDR